MLIRNRLFLLASLLLTMSSAAQIRFSICTDLDLQRNFKKEQRYWAGGHTVSGNFHFSPTDIAYAWISYYSSGHFYNELKETAQSPSTLPQQIAYTNRGSMRVKQISVGWKKILNGRFDDDTKVHYYAYGGFGLVLGRISNTHSVTTDTTLYQVPVLAGKANFKRLSMDFGAGAEFPMGADVFFYSELRAWVPTTNYPSKYLFVNNDAPLMGMFCAGLRILF